MTPKTEHSFTVFYHPQSVILGFNVINASSLFSLDMLSLHNLSYTVLISSRMLKDSVSSLRHLPDIWKNKQPTDFGWLQLVTERLDLSSFLS